VSEQDGPTIIGGLVIDAGPEQGVSVSRREWTAYCNRVEKLGQRALSADDETMWFGIAATSFLTFAVPAVLIPLTSEKWSELVVALFIAMSVLSAVATLRFWLCMRRPKVLRIDLAKELANEMRALVPGGLADPDQP
jgi:hypothetical protein